MSQQARNNEDINAYLDRHQNKQLLRFLTCGSVDDGKSTLIGRLLHDSKTLYEDQLAAVKKDSVKHGTTGEGQVDLALVTDGLRAEREQGITIDVAYRYFSTDKRKFIIADTPGHEQYTRNMATGASTAQLSIILIDARHGVMTQTKRHSFICSLLGIRHLVIAINKMDLVGFAEGTFEQIKKDYLAFAAPLGIREAEVQFIPMSALKGDNVVDPSKSMPWYKGPALLAYLERVPLGNEQNLTELRLPIQLVLRPDLNFRGFCGTLASGVLKKGDAIRVLPSGKTSRIKSIITFDGELGEAFAPQAVTITLEDEIDVSRGDMIVHDLPANEHPAEESLPHIASDLDAMIVWMHAKPLAPGRTYLLKHTTRMVSGEVASVRFAVDVNTLKRLTQPSLALNEIGRCHLTLSSPLVFDAYKKNRHTGGFILIDRLDNNTVAAGMILDPADRDFAGLGGAGDAWNTSATDSLVARTSFITLADREKRLRQKAGTILITGLTGSGKSLIARQLELALFGLGALPAVLYGSNMRRGISRDLGFSADERSENLRRSAEIAKILNDSGILCIAAFVAPHEAVRQKVRQLIGVDRFLEVFLSAPAEYCRKHDRTGIWQRAENNEIKSFPGLSAPYDPPGEVDLVIPTHEVSTEEATARILSLLKQKAWIGD